MMTLKRDTKFDCIIIDEVHSIKANNKISKIIADLPAKLRYGFTGTLPHDKHDKWSILGKIGPVRFELPSAELRKDKFLTQVSTFGINIQLMIFRLMSWMMKVLKGLLDSWKKPNG